ncbi:MAG: SDR family NAD(P)-dependent oxidoreductase [bacterium]
MQARSVSGSGVTPRVVITGITGTLGESLGRHYREAGSEVIGVSRRPGEADEAGEACTRRVANAQRDAADARALLDLDPDLLFLVAGQIEEELGEGGMPLAQTTIDVVSINQLFPSLVAIEAAARPRARRLDVIAVGSIADGAPSCFGPVYHASKIGLHHFYTGVAPIAFEHNPKVRLRLYRPGAIQGPLAWAPVRRLNDRGRRIRARRVEGAPEGARVAEHLARFAESDRWVGTWDEPISFQLLKLLFGLAPNLYARLQQAGWRRGSRFAGRS